MGYIYQIKNKITGKCYIGQTTKLPESRWKQHMNSLTKKGGCPALKDAITKYGIDSFTFCVLIICFDNAVHLIEKEYIEKYHAQVPNGYNILPGGQLGGGFLGKTHSAKSIEKIKESGKKFREANPHHFETYREKLKESMKKVDLSTCIKQSEKFQKAKREGRMGTIGPTSEEKKQKISDGLKKYFENNNGSLINKDKHSKIMTEINGKKISQYSKDNELLKTFDSIVLASKHTKIGRRSIQSNLAGRSKSSGGFIWKYSDTELKDTGSILE
jgi:group I intron endonuclease